MARLWRGNIARRLGLPVAAVVVSTTLSSCLGWSTQVSTTDGSSLSALSCPSASKCVAVGSDSSGNALVEQTTDAGRTWVRHTAGVSGLGLDAVSCPDPEHCVAVGGVSLGGIIDPSNSVLVTADGGANWQASTVSSVDGYLTSVSCPDAEHCWATAAVGIVGTSNIVVSTDGARSWTVLRWNAPGPPAGEFGPSSSQLDGVDCPTTSDCLAVGEAAYQPTTAPSNEEHAVISITNDGGQTWQSQVVAASDITGVSCPDAQSCVAIGQGNTALGGAPGETPVAYHIDTLDGGATWTVSTPTSATQSTGDAPAINAVSCVDSLHCVAAGVVYNNDKYETPLLTTSDGGATWSNQAANPDDSYLEGLSCVTASVCWAVGFTPTGSIVLHTVNGGVARPSVSSISPDQAPASGGTQITIGGAGFEYGSVLVQFGSAVATDVTVDSDTELTLTVPPQSSADAASGSTVDVSVTNSLGTSPLTSSDRFTYGAGP